MRKRKVFTHGVRRGLPTHAYFIPLDFVEGSNHHILPAEILEEIDNAERWTELKPVRLGNGPVVLLDIVGIQEIILVRNGLLLIKVRRKGCIERNERNKPRVKTYLELLGTCPFIAQNSVGPSILSCSNAIHAVEGRGIVTDFVGFRVLHVDCPFSAIFHSPSNRIPRHNHHAVLGNIDLAVRMVIVEYVITSKKTAFFCGKEILLHKTFPVAPPLHITGDVQRVRRVQPRKDIPAHVQFVIQVRSVGYHLGHLGFHEVRVSILIHITHIIEIKQSHIKSLRPGFKFRCRHSLAKSIVKLGKSFKRFFSEQGKRSQLVLQNSPVGICRVGAGSSPTFGFRVRIACRRPFQENLG